MDLDQHPELGYELFEGFFITPFDLHRWVSNAMEWAIILTPLMLYLFYLGLGVNWRHRPKMMGGVGNALGLWFALSGFFLVGPLAWGAHYLKPWGPAWYWGAYAIYVGALLILSAWGIARQRQILVIYNIEPAVFSEVLKEALVEQRVVHTITPSQVSFGSGDAVLDVESFVLLGNVRLRWRGVDAELRASTEGALRQKLYEVSTSVNLSTALFTLAAGFLLVYIYFAVALYTAVHYF